MVLGEADRGQIDIIFYSGGRARDSQPVTKAHVVLWHAVDTYFGVRVMRPRSRDGKIMRR